MAATSSTTWTAGGTFVLERPVGRLEELTGPLHCYDADGTLRWQVEAGGEVVWDGVRYPNEFRPRGFGTASFGDGRRFVLLYGNHLSGFASHLIFADPAGNLLGHYGHTGYLFDHAMRDIDNDGVDEVFIGGFNNLRGAPTVAVVRPMISRGSISPVPQEYAPGFQPSNELAYYTFPKGSLATALNDNARVARVRDIAPGVEIHVELARTHHVDRQYLIGDDLAIMDVEIPLLALGVYETLRAADSISWSIADERRALLQVDSVLNARSASEVINR